jgi:hypothetical protein
MRGFPTRLPSNFRARLSAESLIDCPGIIPTTLNTAYDYQDRAIALWPDNLAGWKVGRIGAPWFDNELGPTVVVSDFGNNAELLLGPAIPAAPSCSRRSLMSPVQPAARWCGPNPLAQPAAVDAGLL